MLFIYNPHAGKASIRSNLLDIVDIFTRAGYEVTAQPTQKKGDAIENPYKKTLKYVKNENNPMHLDAITFLNQLLNHIEENKQYIFDNEFTSIKEKQNA